MDKLNLPVYDLNIKETEGKTVIFDVIRKKFVVLTPEEWVRQHFVNYLIHHLGYSRSLISVEHGLKYNALAKRTDIIVYSNKGVPILLVECKAPEHKLGQKVMEQAMMYNKTVNADYLVITNGLEHSCLFIDRGSNELKFLSEIPSFEDINKKS
ncbi:MAG: type I restriction enzyme HsdR N-terminal domain-containing protein [Bacteroidota bacterium]